MGSLSVPPKLPVINFSKEDLKPGTSSWLSTAKEVLHALEEYGCFVAEYDKVPTKLHSSLFSSVKDLFDLPVETKQKNVSEIPFVGYSAAGMSMVAPLYQGMGFMGATIAEETQTFTNTMWPDGNDHFCETVQSFTKLVGELEQTVMRMVFERYGIDHYYESHKELTAYLFRMMKYKVPEKDEDNLGCHSHTDKYLLTILHQNHVTGLEVKTKDGQWIGFDNPSPSSFVVMAGESLLAWSNDRIYAPFHRVILGGSEPRYSVGLFGGHKGLIEVPKELIDDQHPLKFKPFDIPGMLRYFLTEEGQKQESTVKGYSGV
ncbi:hypothetical protein Tsubulata_942121 [Turnera subulata]|uniref:Fe2OG dioxygenase domain-containing protein n=1 Tax=Turnera subulata TaxID=218843 RepID=A0A9Q0JBE7_9ROSI|nr:hypothetical protein Tsubulata_942121 [Turnera subulata]